MLLPSSASFILSVSSRNALSFSRVRGHSLTLFFLAASFVWFLGVLPNLIGCVARAKKLVVSFWKHGTRWIIQMNKRNVIHFLWSFLSFPCSTVRLTLFWDAWFNVVHIKHFNFYCMIGKSPLFNITIFCNSLRLQFKFNVYLQFSVCTTAYLGQKILDFNHLS